MAMSNRACDGNDAHREPRLRNVLSEEERAESRRVGRFGNRDSARIRAETSGELRASLVYVRRPSTPVERAMSFTSESADGSAEECLDVLNDVVKELPYPPAALA